VITLCTTRFNTKTAHSAFCVVRCMLLNCHRYSRLQVCDAVVLHKHKQFPTFHRTLVSLSSGPSILFEVPDMNTKALWSFKMLGTACVCAEAQRHIQVVLNLQKEGPLWESQIWQWLSHVIYILKHPHYVERVQVAKTFQLSVLA
jgi:hypothetical protein